MVLRLELQTAVVAVRLKDKIIDYVDFEFHEITFFLIHKLFYIISKIQNKHVQYLFCIGLNEIYRNR